MKLIRNLSLAAAAATLLFQTPIAQADDHGAQRITFQKCLVPAADEPFGGHFAGTADGDCGSGIILARYLSISPGADASKLTSGTVPHPEWRTVHRGTPEWKAVGAAPDPDVLQLAGFLA